MKVLLAFLLLVIPVFATEKCPCPSDTQFLAKYEWEDGWMFAEGEDVVDLSGDSYSVEWSTDAGIEAVMAKAGQECHQFEGGHSGTVTAWDKELSSLNFCKDKPTAVGLTSFRARSLTPHWAVTVALLTCLVAGWLVVCRAKNTEMDQ